MRHGVDISANQGDINFQQMCDFGAEFVIIRKSLGYYQDVRFMEYAEGADKVGLEIGAYGVPFVGYDIKRQAEAYMNGISPSDLTFPPFIDVERRHSYSLSKAISDVLAYAYILKNWWGDADFYTAKYCWEDYYNDKPGWIDDWGPLWVANYNEQSQPTYIPIGWERRKDGTCVPVEDSWAIHQYSADGNNKGLLYGVSSRDIDLDRMQEWYWNLFVKPVQPAQKITLTIPRGIPYEVIEV